jgi:ADP-ribose pyrophosphatase
MTLREWPREGQDEVRDYHVFRVRRVIARSPRTGQPHPFTVLECPDWVNVIARTKEGTLVLIRQFRHGTREITLEIPGGMVEPGEQAADAATRELLEETGYAGEEPVLLGVVEPNPAIQSNTCFTFFVDGCARLREPAPDAGEDIDVLTMAPEETLAAVADGRIRHALVICALRWWQER